MTILRRPLTWSRSTVADQLTQEGAEDVRSGVLMAAVRSYQRLTCVQPELKDPVVPGDINGLVERVPVARSREHEIVHRGPSKSPGPPNPAE